MSDDKPAQWTFAEYRARVDALLAQAQAVLDAQPCDHRYWWGGLCGDRPIVPGSDPPRCPRHAERGQ